MGRASRSKSSCPVCGSRHPLGNATTPIAEVGALLVITFRGNGGRPQQFVGRYRGVHADEVVLGQVGHLFEVTSDRILDITSGRDVMVVESAGQSVLSTAGVRMLLWAVDLLAVDRESTRQEAVLRGHDGLRSDGDHDDHRLDQ